MNGILTPTKSRRDVVLAMRNHVFTIPQMAFLAFLEYTSIVRG
jgi:ABC-type proline/glycine betaine transport system permease subunit